MANLLLIHHIYADDRWIGCCNSTAEVDDFCSRYTGLTGFKDGYTVVSDIIDKDVKAILFKSYL